MFKCLNDKGFTLIEILMVIFFILVLTVLGFVNYRSFERKLELNTSANHIISILHLAQERTISSKGDTVYGVHFAVSAYTLFSSSTYNPSASDNEVYTLPSRIEIYNIALNGGGDNVVFNRITGQTGNDGNVNLRIASNPSEVKTVEISTSGRAGYGASVSPTGSRIVDGRHTHFDLGWSIQGAADLELYFYDTPNPDVSETIDMAGYFNGGQTSFDWTGTVDVNGENQTIRVHTHSLDAFDTSLGIHRDGRVTTKALDVSIDTRDIVSYTAPGIPSVGLFGGTMAVQ